jgi:hypothetical protein
MFRIANKHIIRPVNSIVFSNVGSRGIFGSLFNWKNRAVPSNKEQQIGRRKDEVDAEEKHVTAFNREPIIPSSDAGTQENPILVKELISIDVSVLTFVLSRRRFHLEKTPELLDLSTL